MFGLGKLTWLIMGPITVSVFGAILFKNLQEMFWSSAPGVVQFLGFRRRRGGNRDDDADR